MTTEARSGVGEDWGQLQATETTRSEKSAAVRDIITFELTTTISFFDLLII
jgi:hypothetical protein